MVPRYCFYQENELPCPEPCHMATEFIGTHLDQGHLTYPTAVKPDDRYKQ